MSKLAQIKHSIKFTETSKDYLLLKIEELEGNYNNLIEQYSNCVVDWESFMEFLNQIEEGEGNERF